MITKTNISIIIRFKNEAQYLENVFEAILNQDINLPVEIISVNNNSTDDSRLIASIYSDSIIDIYNYEPGLALNAAIEKSKGSIIVVLSAHTIPGNKSWLKNLIEPLLDGNKHKELIATYGSQIYPFYSNFLDKRDLDLFNFAPTRTEYKDTDFWNANSAFNRNIWESNKFCEEVYELEDHYWTKEILSKQKGYVLFNPDAYVYHYGHDDRIDRKYPKIAADSFDTVLKKSHKFLNNSNRWSEIMWAALVCNSIPKEFLSNEITGMMGKLLVEHWDFDVRWRIAQTLGNIPSNISISFLSKALADSSFYVRNEAAWSLKKLLPSSRNEVLKAFKSTNNEAKLYAAFVLGASENEGSEIMSFDYLNDLLINGIESDILRSLYIIGEISNCPKSLNSIYYIINILESPNISGKTLSIAIWCLGKIYEKHSFDFPMHILLKLIKTHDSFFVRYESIIALGRLLTKTNNNNILKEIYNQLSSESDNRVNYAICQTIRVLCERNGYRFYISVKDIEKINDFGVQFECALIKKLENNGTYRYK
jgi:glycosyltransferase involved in cell wall biosynthesis